MPSSLVRFLGRPRYLLQLGVVATAYVAAGKLGITLSVAHGVITPVWAPSGIALVVLGSGLSTLISATNGIAVLSLAGAAPLGSDWLLWWFGDAVGILMVTP